MKTIRVAVLVVLCGVWMTGAARAQDGWNVAVYPVLVWVPLDVGIGVEIPPFENDSGGLGDIEGIGISVAYIR